MCDKFILCVEHNLQKKGDENLYCNVQKKTEGEHIMNDKKIILSPQKQQNDTGMECTNFYLIEDEHSIPIGQVFLRFEQIYLGMHSPSSMQ